MAAIDKPVQINPWQGPHRLERVLYDKQDAGMTIPATNDEGEIREDERSRRALCCVCDGCDGAAPRLLYVNQCGCRVCRADLTMRCVPWKNKRGRIWGWMHVIWPCLLRP